LKPHVDALVGKLLHAAIMVIASIDRVDIDGVGTKLVDHGRVCLALFGIGQWVRATSARDIGNTWTSVLVEYVVRSREVRYP
jgi:hypothetical protein